MGQKRNEEIAYFSLSAVNQMLIIMCMCMSNTAYWRMETRYDLTASEMRYGIWQICEESDGKTTCETLTPQNDFHQEVKAHLNAARAFVIISIVTASLVLIYFLFELFNLTGFCGKFCSRYGFAVVLLIQIGIVVIACSLCQSFFNQNFESYRLGWAAWLTWVGFILSVLSTVAAFLYLRYQDYW